MPTPPTARDRVERLLDRIESVDLHTNAVCTLHPDALAQAETLDAEAAAGRVRGPLHGVPVLVKDNVDTHDLPTTAGSLALADAPPPAQDATLVRRIRRGRDGRARARPTSASGPTSATAAPPRGGAPTAG